MGWSMLLLAMGTATMLVAQLILAQGGHPRQVLLLSLIGVTLMIVAVML